MTIYDMSEAWQIILEGRALVNAGGRLYTKGSNGIPRRLRAALLDKIDATIPVTLTTLAAKTAAPDRIAIEHLVPMKRIAIEIIDPSGHDPRTGGNSPIILGPARDLIHAEEIARQMIIKARVMKDEHVRLNSAQPSFQWDAPGANGYARYQAAGIELFKIEATG